MVGFSSDLSRRKYTAWTRRILLGPMVCLGLLGGPVSGASTSVDVGAYKGRVVYLDFWASWCAPCQQSFPWMQAMKVAYENQGLTVLAIDLDRNREDADRFLAKFNPEFDVRFDSAGDTAKQFKVSGMPTSVIFDRQGVPRFTHIGFRPVDRQAYEAEIRALLQEKSSTSEPGQ
jgi:thiol-disulfide isomerase/thioredoxin